MLTLFIFNTKCHNLQNGGSHGDYFSVWVLWPDMSTRHNMHFSTDIYNFILRLFNSPLSTEAHLPAISQRVTFYKSRIN